MDKKMLMILGLNLVIAVAGMAASAMLQDIQIHQALGEMTK